MFRLMVVDGPSRGATYTVQDGETSIGRQAGNVITLQSTKVSKRHCVLVARDGQLLVRDQGSSNGTFVNGALVKEKRLSVGDKISVGEFVLQIAAPLARRAPPPAPIELQRAAMGQVIPFPGPMPGSQQHAGASHMHAGPPAAPKDLKGRVIWLVEQKVMPFFYTLLTKNEWRGIALTLFGAFALANLFVSVMPLLEQGREAVVKETARRAVYIAREIADRNAPILAQKAETRTDIGAAENAEGVRAAVLIDLDSRIIAPAAKMNSYFTGGSEAVYATRARDLFRQGRESGVVAELDSSTVAAIEPVKVLNPKLGKNEVVAMAVVSIDTSLATPGLGDMGVTYSETLILTTLIGAVILFILYRLTLKPFLVLSEDMDKALKGEIPQVTHTFKFQEVAPLWDLVNTALQRASTSSGAGSQADLGPKAEDMQAFARAVGETGRTAIALCDGDRRVVYLSALFEEISGIRQENAAGQDLASQARDQAFGAMIGDAFSRTVVGGEPVVEDFDFSGVSYKTYTASVGGPSGATAYVMVAVKNEG